MDPSSPKRGWGDLKFVSRKNLSSHPLPKLLAELWLHLGTDEEGGTPYGGDVGK